MATSWLLIDLYQVYHHEKCIIKIEEKKSPPISWIVLLIIWGVLLLLNISDYIKYKEMRFIDNILFNLAWIELAIIIITKSLRCSEIRENGIYYSGDFYKWSKIKSYSWILPNKIQLTVTSTFGADSSFEININEELKLKADEIIKNKLDV